MLDNEKLLQEYKKDELKENIFSLLKENWGIDKDELHEILEELELHDLSEVEKILVAMNRGFTYVSNYFIKRLQESNSFISRQLGKEDAEIKSTIYLPLAIAEVRKRFFTFKGSRAGELYFNLVTTKDFKGMSLTESISDFAILAKILSTKKMIKKVNRLRLSSFNTIFNSLAVDMSIRDVLREYYGKEVYKVFEDYMSKNEASLKSIKSCCIILKYISENNLEIDVPFEWIESMNDSEAIFYGEV